MMGQVIQIDKARIHDHLGEMVRGTVEEIHRPSIRESQRCRTPRDLANISGTYLGENRGGFGTCSPALPSMADSPAGQTTRAAICMRIEGLIK